MSVARRIFELMGGYFRSLLALPRAVHFYLLSELLFGIGLGIGMIILNFHYVDLGLAKQQIGALNSFYGIALALLSYPAGVVTDRFGAKRAMIIGVAGVVAGYATIATFSSLFSLYAAQFLIACGFSLVFACEFPYIMSLCEREEDETTAYNLLNTAFTMALTVGTLLGPVLPEIMPQGDTAYQTGIYLIALSFGIMWVMRMFLPASSQRVAKAQSEQPKSINWRVKPSRGVMIFLGYTLLAGFLYSMMNPLENVLQRDRFGFTDDQVSYLMAAGTFVNFLVSLFVPYIMALPSRRRYLYAGFALQMVTLFGLGLLIPAFLYSLLFLGKGVSGMFNTSFVDSLTMKATAEHERGLHSGLRTLVRSGAGAVASVWAGYLLGAGDTHTSYLFSFFVVGIQVCYYFFAVRHQLARELDEPV